MVKLVAVTINIIASAYFMGGMLAQHEKAKALVAGLEDGFIKLLFELKEKRPSATVGLLLMFFGYLTGAAFGGMFLAGIIGIRSQHLTFVLSSIFLISGLLAGSLFWVLNHKEVLKKITYWLLFFGGGSLFFPVMDILTDAGITNAFYSMIQMQFARLVDLPSGNGLLYESLVLTGFYAGSIIFLYLISWCYAAPIALIAWSLVALPIFGARAINRAFPERPIAFVFFILWLLSFLYLSYAGCS